MTTYLTVYLLESGLSLLVLLGAYRLFLENQPLHRLKRTYLLGTLAVSLAAPLLIIEVPPGTLPVTVLPHQLADRQTTDLAEQPAAPPATASANVPEPVSFGLWLYAAGTLLMLGRFGRNLYVLTAQIRANPTQSFRGAVLVKLPGEGPPYTFLHYLFVSDAAYGRGEIEGELFTHELAHIRQRHSLDVLLVELVLCVGWVNPGLFWLKRTMQRNHEFLADAAVNTTHGNVPAYQRLLLSKLTPAAPRLSLTSTLTFQTTKQRLTMMTKHASLLRTWLVGCAAALLFGMMTVLLSTRTVAQQTPTVPALKVTMPKPAPQSTVAEMERQFSEKFVSIPMRVYKPGEGRKRFKDLTPAEKQRVIVLKPDDRKTPTEAEWNDFKNTKKYGIWVNGKRRRDNPIAKYNRTDIVSYWSSFVHKNARQPEGYLYQLDLSTEHGYQKTLKEWEEEPWLHLMTVEQFDKRRNGKAR